MRIRERAAVVLAILRRNMSQGRLMMLLAVAVGLLSGAAAYAFESLMELIEHALVGRLDSDPAGWLRLIYPACGIVLASIFVSRVIRDDISEGVTKVLYAISMRESRIRPHNCYSSVVGGAVTIGFGGSVGPEAPIVLTGAALGSSLAGRFRLDQRSRTVLLGCGVAGTVAAIFRAPVTGLVFVLEILMQDFTMTAIVPLLISSVSAVALTFILGGLGTKFSVSLGELSLATLPWYALLAAVCALMAYFFKSANARISSRIASIGSQRVRWAVGAVTLGALIFLCPPLYGAGYGTIASLLMGNPVTDSPLFQGMGYAPWAAVTFMTATALLKVAATAVTNSCGGVGGTFAPSLMVGALTGSALALALNTWCGTQLPAGAFALVGMAGVMASVMNAPLTSIFLIAELSGGYSLFLPLMLTATLSFAMGHGLEPDSIYTKKLRMRHQLMTHNKDQALMTVMNLQGMIETDFSVVNEKATLGDMVRSVVSTHRNIFPVTDSAGVLKGLITLDGIRADMFDTLKYSTPAVCYMTPVREAILEGEPMAEVMAKLERTGAWNLPVTDPQGRYLGMISRSRILSAYREKLLQMSQD